MKRLFFLSALLLVIATSLLAVLPFFHSGLFEVHDPTSIIRLATLKNTIASGQFPAVWTNELNRNFGYPIFQYYAPLFSYLTLIVSVFSPTLLFAFKTSVILLVVVGSIGVYKLLSDRGRASAIIGTLAFSLLPYHAVTLYVRGSYSEVTTWVLLPWLLYFWKLPLKSKKDIFKTTIITALFLLSHNTVPFFFLPILLIWIYLHQHQHIYLSLLSLALSLGISSWFLLPVIFENSFVQALDIATKTSLYEHFLNPIQLWHSAWGYGGSSPIGSPDGMSFMLGKFQVLIAIFGLAIAVIKRKFSPELWFGLGMVVFYGFATTTFSIPAWRLVPMLGIIQFPWRLITYASFGLVILDVIFVSEITLKTLRYIAYILVSLLLIFFNLKFFQPQLFLPLNDGSFLTKENYDLVAQNKIPEYLPTWMPDFPTSSSNDGLTRTPTKVFGTIEVSNTEVRVETAYMPQWQLKLDGKVTPITPASDGAITTKNKLSPGIYNLELTWVRTNLEKLSILITIVSLLVVIGLAI